MSRVNKIEKIETPAEVDEKEITKQVEIIKEDMLETDEQPKKRGRGRPRKNPAPVEDKKEEKKENKTAATKTKPKTKKKVDEPKTEEKVGNKTKAEPKVKKEIKIKEKPEVRLETKTKVKKELEPEVEEVEEDEDVQEEQIENEKTINLKDIKKTLKNKIDTTQKKSLIKELIIYCGMAVLMIFHLFVLYMGTKNIALDILINDMKIITLSILAIGIGTLEFSYKKDDFKIALRGLEVLVFGASNLCLVYVTKLYFNEVVNFLKYIGIVIIAYYLVKIITTAICTIRKYKKDNNDIKEIVKKVKR